MQIGKGNQAVTGSTAGENSPVVTAGGDVNFFNVRSSPRSYEGGDGFEGLEALMLEFLNRLRTELSDNPLIREFIVTESASTAVNMSEYRPRFTRADDPQIMNKVKI